MSFHIFFYAGIITLIVTVAIANLHMVAAVHRYVWV
jgi:hypothetical protein